MGVGGIRMDATNATYFHLTHSGNYPLHPPHLRVIPAQARNPILKSSHFVAIRKIAKNSAFEQKSLLLQRYGGKSRNTSGNFLPSLKETAT
jgi:hypothetical protein